MKVKLKIHPSMKTAALVFTASLVIAVCQPKPKSSPVAKFPIKSSISNNNNFLGGREVVR